MLRAKEVGLFTQRLEVSLDGRPLTVFRGSPDHDCVSRFELEDCTFVVRIEDWGDTLSLRADDGELLARLEGAYRRQWRVTTERWIYHFRHTMSFGLTTVELVHQDRLLGRIEPTGAANLRATVDLPGVPLLDQLFVLVVAYLVWRRQRIGVSFL